ncbi:MAG TPA: hypothetical protein VFO17_06190 [Acidimicrobiia bacterium]|jgi:hypothetical protein|nr:hypothetical protein [Acidimicrobiia bacterium]
MLDLQRLFVERLGEHDLEVLASLDDVALPPADLRSQFLRDPGSVVSRLGDPRLYQALFEDDPTERIHVLSPSLAFGVLVQRTIRDLQSTSYVPEWVGAGERLPVFDVTSLREFIENPARQYLIIDLLASFTRVASGSMWVRTQRGYHRRRYSELDPLSLAEMVAGLPRERRGVGYRRLGDVALFLTGVFPDHTARNPLSEMRRERLIESTGVAADFDIGIEYIHFLELAGRRWYDRAASGPFPPPEGEQLLHDLADNFSAARRFLNYLADTYLHRLPTGLMNPIG